MDENYIVRIYRRALTVESETAKQEAGKQDTEELVGVVEDAVNGQRYPFHNMQELMAIFNTPLRPLD